MYAIVRTCDSRSAETKVIIRPMRESDRFSCPGCGGGPIAKTEDVCAHLRRHERELAGRALSLQGERKARYLRVLRDVLEKHVGIRNREDCTCWATGEGRYRREL